MTNPVSQEDTGQQEPAVGRPRRPTLTQRIGDALRRIPRPGGGGEGGGGGAAQQAADETQPHAAGESVVMDQSSSESEEETVLHHRPMTLNQVMERGRKGRRKGGREKGQEGGREGREEKDKKLGDTCTKKCKRE